MLQQYIPHPMKHISSHYLAQCNYFSILRIKMEVTRRELKYL